MHSVIEKKCCKNKDRRRAMYPVDCIVVKTKSSCREQAINDGGSEDSRRHRWKRKDRDNQSNDGKEMSDLLKSNQPI